MGSTSQNGMAIDWRIRAGQSPVAVRPSPSFDIAIAWHHVTARAMACEDEEARRSGGPNRRPALRKESVLQFRSILLSMGP